MKCWHLVGTVSLSVACIGGSFPAQAAGNDAEPADSGGLQEVVVTAQRREETVQKSSLAVQAIAGDDLRKAGVTQATDLNQLVPGLQLSMGGTETQIYIRGVGDFSATPLGNPAVAFNVDGVYVARGDAVNSNFYDVSRVEVLKGPQGTLYGRNASGGAINLLTNVPVLDSFSGNVTLEGGNYDTRKVEAAVNLPIGDQLAVRAAVNWVDRGGYLSDGTNDDLEHAARIRALWQPNANFSVLLNTDISHLGGQGPGYVLFPRLPGQDPWTSASSPAGVAAQLASAPFLFPIDGRTNFQDSTFRNISAELNWDFGPATLTLLPAYRYVNINWQSDPGLDIKEPNTSKERTFEARLAHSTDTLHWVTGLYFYDESQHIVEDIDATEVVQGLGNLLEFDPHTRSEAAFGQVTYSILPRLRVIAGLRYTRDRANYDGTGLDYDLRPSFITGAPSPALVEQFSGGRTFVSFTWKGGLEFDVTPDNMLYFTASTGYKAGGLNQTTGALGIYEPEKIMAYELGARNRFLDNRLQVNLELYRWNYGHPQESKNVIDEAFQINFLTVNAGDATIEGANLDVVAKLTRTDTVRATAEYNRSIYNNFVLTLPYSVFGTQIFNPLSTGCRAGAPFGAPSPVLSIQEDCSGFQVARAPLWSGSFGYDHEFEFRNGASLDAGLTGQFGSARYLSVDFLPLERAPGYVTENFDLTFTTPSEHLQFTGYVHNLSNEAVYTGGIIRSFGSNLFYASIDPPRTYGLRATWTF